MTSATARLVNGSNNGVWMKRDLVKDVVPMGCPYTTENAGEYYVAAHDGGCRRRTKREYGLFNS